MIYTSARNVLESKNKAASDKVLEVKARLMVELNAKESAMGLTPDVVKFHPDYVQAKAELDAAGSALRVFNKTNYKQLQAERKTVK